MSISFPVGRFQFRVMYSPGFLAGRIGMVSLALQKELPDWRSGPTLLRFDVRLFHHAAPQCEFVGAQLVEVLWFTDLDLSAQEVEPLARHMIVHRLAKCGVELGD